MQNLEKYFGPLSNRQSERFLQLGVLYAYWNERINIISRKDIGNLYLHHILHSLSIAKIIRFIPGTRVIDAGTGGGFPGIPLAILFPDVHFILADSIAKKIRVVETVIRETGLTNCEVRNLRLEDINDKTDFVVCRAVAEIPVLFGWVKKNIIHGGENTMKNGLLALKGGNLDAELKPMVPGVKIFNLGAYFSEAFFETKKLVYLPV